MNAEPARVTAVRWGGPAAAAAAGATACRNGTTIPVDASCTHTDTRVAPDWARRRSSWPSTAVSAS